ncbi:uncharacterized protein K489DRAFT_130728 [Dissoconium aciculare CBS 342.82]|uniref:Transmembrane protein n=1 Tax=Dissoconium aciculare CBS 342.82 TaxID=1314786 RepID=A0A6J3LQU0_9PEZI|nr:uncharacterized protein K489DRAFT_130728 [Dissoconium aciculare CBS 342.82]KAF1818205.1 hypothetical protein K489DRAFT_130728 [Dissoconium aciculare CBS 342.82]
MDRIYNQPLFGFVLLGVQSSRQGSDAEVVATDPSASGSVSRSVGRWAGISGRKRASVHSLIIFFLSFLRSSHEVGVHGCINTRRRERESNRRGMSDSNDDAELQGGLFSPHPLSLYSSLSLSLSLFFLFPLFLFLFSLSSLFFSILPFQGSAIG